MFFFSFLFFFVLFFDSFFFFQIPQLFSPGLSSLNLHLDIQNRKKEANKQLDSIQEGNYSTSHLVEKWRDGLGNLAMI